MTGRVLVDGSAAAPVLATDVPLSLWGGIDVEAGTIIDQHHPLVGRTITGRILVLPAGRGSSAASAMLLETILAGTGPAGLLLGGVDEILAVGALVADEMFGSPIPVLTLDADTFAAASAAHHAVITPGGHVTFDHAHADQRTPA